eukprot:TRINITY_DN11648_c0_g1_i1.p1 TRINITY_DN11648_c0_g1~~TRINITY_DN11648_c0_g1_i1.p1  ORF type:complete len:342 (-),score=57.17 TRINITY_DN11648_c0_g1_i1:557-1582(-)
MEMEKDGDEERSSPSSKRSNLRSSGGEGEKASETTSTLRFLVSNSAAGSVIGKGGATISEFQVQSGARIQLSRNKEFFPGTTDRIILLSGTVSAILTALHLIVSKILSELQESNSTDTSNKPSHIRLIVPNAMCGAIIGKGGATIRSFVEDSGAAIKLTSQEQSLPGMTDRIVTITGTLEQQLRAVALIVTKMSEDPHYSLYANMPISYSASSQGPSLGATVGLGSPLAAFALPGLTTPGAYSSRGSRHSGSSVHVVSPATTTLTVAVPDEHIGAIVGKAGKSIAEIQQATGAKIKISDRGDFVPNTNNRKVTLSGSTDAVQLAQIMIVQKVQQSASDYGR